MKAVRIHEHGTIDVLTIDELDKPKPTENDVLVKIKAASINHLDIFVRNGIPGVPLPLIMGSDASGEVTELGENVEGEDHLKIGDEVILVPYRSCQNCSACLAGEDQLCKRYHILGEHLDGSQAE